MRHFPVLLLLVTLSLVGVDSNAQTTQQWLDSDRSKISELEQHLTFPTQINITVRQDQVVRVTGGARRHSNPSQNIDEILVTKFVGNFECQDKVGTNRPGNYVDTHELKGFWFGSKNTMKSAKNYNGYAAIAQATDNTDRKILDTAELVESCEGSLFPDGEVTTVSITQPIALGAWCTGDKEASGLALDFSLVVYEAINTDSFRINLTCDKRLIKARRMQRRTSDGRYIHRCPEGTHINGTHNNVAYTKTTKPRYCRNSELAIKVKKEPTEPEALTVYEVHCPDGFYVKNSDLKYSLSTKRYPPGDYLCFPYKYTWTQKKG
ncbi:MAG: hypothetical protein AAF462_08900 [Thermodesulfobacteriota bacterium]